MTKKMVLFLTITVLVIGSSSIARALEPKLLWQKKLPFEIFDIKLAKESGDVVLSSKEARRVISYDRNGNVRFQWGPRIDRLPFYVDIASNGTAVVFNSSWTENYIRKKKIDMDIYGSNGRVHYVDKNGKEKWNLKIDGASAYLSPDGNLAAIGFSGGFGGPLKIVDSSGKTKWQWGSSSTSIEDAMFSPDGNFLAVSDGAIHLFTRDGTHLWQGGQGIKLSISKDATFLSALFEDEDAAVYDKQGTVFLRKRGIITADGSKIMVIDTEKVTLIKLPLVEIVREYPISASISANVLVNADISSDGHYIVIGGNRVGTESNIFMMDTVADFLWETKTAGQISRVFLTKDGKYMLSVIGSRELRYYQVY